MNENYRPLNDDVMIIHIPRDQIEEKTFIIQENPGDNKEQYFKVHAAGPQVTEVSVGDVVLVPWTRVTPPVEVRIDGENKQVGFTSQKEIWAVLEQ